MSSIAMAADSTQSEQKVKKKQSKRKKQRSYTTSSSSSDDSHEAPVTKEVKKASKEAKTNSSDSNCESDLDLSKELLTISGYVDDREAMIDNMFKSISSKKMKTMLPEILQPLSLKELKALCLEQLHVMSSKRVVKILAGDDPETISSSASDEGETEAGEELCSRTKNKTIPCKYVEEKAKVSECCQNSSDVVNKDGNQSKVPSQSPKEILVHKNIEQNVNNHHTKKLVTKLGNKEPGTNSKDEFDESSLKKINANSHAVAELDPNEDDNSRNTDDPTSSERNYACTRRILVEEKQKIEKVEGTSKSRLEILELEMRARAIKAMLKVQEEQEKQTKRRSCEAKTESRTSHYEGRETSRDGRSEHSEKGSAPRRDRGRSGSKRASGKSYPSASFEDGPKFWEKQPTEEHSRRNWEERRHHRESDRCHEWRDKYRNC